MKGTDVTERESGNEERGLLDGVPVLRLIIFLSSEQKLCVSSLIRVSRTLRTRFSRETHDVRFWSVRREVLPA